MSAPAYTIAIIDLATANDSKTLDNTLGSAVSAITIQQLPFGAVVSLKLGPTRPQIPLTVQGQTITLCPAADEGIFVTNPAGGGQLIIIVWFADSGQALGA